MKQLLIQFDILDSSASKFVVVNNGPEVDVTIVVCESNYNIPISVISLCLAPGVKYWFITQQIDFLIHNSNFFGFRHLIIDNKTGERCEYKTSNYYLKKLDITLPDKYLLGDSFLPFYDAVYSDRIDYMFEKNYNGWFIDLGANLGAYTSAAIIHGCQNCLLVEPSPQLVESLNETFINYSGVKIEQGVVTDKSEETALLKINGPAQVGNHVSDSGDLIVNNFRISDLVNKYQISEISLLKIDIEGQEYDVVPNLEKSILDITHSISLETHIMYGGDDFSLVNYLVENGFNHKTVTERDSHKEHFFWK